MSPAEAGSGIYNRWPTQHSAAPIRAKSARLGAPATCWAILSPSRCAGLGCWRLRAKKLGSYTDQGLSR